MKNVKSASEEVKISEKFEFELTREILQSELNELTDFTCERLVFQALFFFSGKKKICDFSTM